MTSPVFTRCRETRHHLVTHNSGNSVAMRPLTQLGYISEALAGLSSVRGVTVKQSVLREKSYMSVIKRSSRRSELQRELKTLRVQQCAIISDSDC
jgi:hypothetical protein